jgi:glycosyltransferase involved in cell wall biosynthesis
MSLASAKQPVVSNPEATILMAVYNGREFLHEAIESVLEQTFDNFEFLIINDGSTDGNREIILSYTDPRIRFLDNPENIGLTRSLNLGLKKALDAWIVRTDAGHLEQP